jgi:MtfA peptidase
VLFETNKHRHGREVREAGFTNAWRSLLETTMAHWAWLNDDERERLGMRAVDFLASKRWEAARGFDMSDGVTMLISAEASLITLELADDAYRGVNTIIVHPTAMVMRGQHSQVQGVVSDDPTPITGQANHNGPVMVAWDAARFQARHPEKGNNVVFHEFAHKLDMLTGTANGTPPMESVEAEAAWVAACTAAYERVVAGRSKALRNYAGVNTAEFFAVATEVLFDTPQLMATHEPDLYAVMADWYRQDPASRQPRR